MACGGTQCTRSFPISEAPLQFAEMRGGFVRLAALLLRLHERQRQRRALRELDDHLLHDIGVTREQAQAEGRKPFWL